MMDGPAIVGGYVRNLIRTAMGCLGAVIVVVLLTGLIVFVTFPLLLM